MSLIEKDFLITTEFRPAPLLLPAGNFESYNKDRGWVPVFTYHHEHPDGSTEHVVLRNQYPGFNIAHDAAKSERSVVELHDPVNMFPYYKDKDELKADAGSDFIECWPGPDLIAVSVNNDLRVIFGDDPDCERAKKWIRENVTLQTAVRFPSYEPEDTYYQPLQYDAPVGGHLIDVILYCGLEDMTGATEPEIDTLGRKHWLLRLEVAGHRMIEYPEMSFFEYFDDAGKALGAAFSLGDMMCYDEATGWRGQSKKFYGPAGDGAGAKDQALDWLRNNVTLIAGIGHEYR